MLLGIAVKWFSGSSDGQQMKTPTELKELQKSRWLFKIRAEIEKDQEVRVITNLDDDDNDDDDVITNLSSSSSSSSSSHHDVWTFRPNQIIYC